MKGNEEGFGSPQGKSLWWAFCSAIPKWTQTTEWEDAPKDVNHSSSCNSWDSKKRNGAGGGWKCIKYIGF